MTSTKKVLLFSLLVAAFGGALVVGYALINRPIQNQVQTENTPPTTTSTKKLPDTAEKITPKPDTIDGKTVSIGNSFKITVPDGWTASVSTQPSFLAIQFARPNKIDALDYNQTRKPKVDYDGIPSWSGLTEHFYVRDVSAANQVFNPAEHAEVTSKSFSFDDGIKGRKYSVTKHATEAQKWGGLQKDNKWYGRVYAYKKGNRVIEAHLAFYPSTNIDSDFFERVAKTISI